MVPPVPLGPPLWPGLCPQPPAPRFLQPLRGSGPRQEHPPGPGMDPEPQHRLLTAPIIEATLNQVQSTANSTQRRKSKPQPAPFLPRARPQHSVIFSTPRAGTADNVAPCENRGREETHSIAPTTSRILTLSLPSGHFLGQRQRDHSARHPMPTLGWVLPCQWLRPSSQCSTGRAQAAACIARSFSWCGEVDVV